MIRSIGWLTVLTIALVPALRGQRLETPRPPDAMAHASAWRNVQRTTWRQDVVHYGKWLAAGGVAAFTALAAGEHHKSSREWDALLAICRSADDACTLGADGRYQRADAEQLYQRSRAYDRRANKRLLGAQASLLLTAALFILDLRPEEGPENIPYSPLEVTASPAGDGAQVGVRIAF